MELLHCVEVPVIKESHDKVALFWVCCETHGNYLKRCFETNDDPGLLYIHLIAEEYLTSLDTCLIAEEYLTSLETDLTAEEYLTSLDTCLIAEEYLTSLDTCLIAEGI